MINDPSDQKTVYDLLNIIIADEEMAARPTVFTYDDEENVTGVIQYETSCPRCSQLVQFGVNEIFEDGEGALYVQGCEDCPISGALTPKVEGADFDSFLNDDSFEDPIANGKMIVEGATKLNV